MSRINASIKNEQVIPKVESSLFENVPNAQFAVGILAVGNIVIPGMENELKAYYELRRAVYIEQTGQLTVGDLTTDGIERDTDDNRSVAFGVIENCDGGQRLVSSARLIVKGLNKQDGQQPEPLPIEHVWPEVFGGQPAPDTAFEVSRLISRHERGAVQMVIKKKLITAGIGFICCKGLGPAYAIVEPWLEKDLSRFVPIRRIGEPKYVAHYLDVNLPLYIDHERLAKRIESMNPGELNALGTTPGTVAYFGTIQQERVAA